MSEVITIINFFCTIFALLIGLVLVVTIIDSLDDNICIDNGYDKRVDYDYCDVSNSKDYICCEKIVNKDAIHELIKKHGDKK